MEQVPFNYPDDDTRRSLDEIKTISKTGHVTTNMDPFVSSVQNKLILALSGEAEGDRYAAKDVARNTGEWFDANVLFPEYWVWGFATDPYWGPLHGRGKFKGTPRYNTVRRGLCAVDSDGGNIGAPMDCSPTLHDLYAWGDLEQFLVPCGVTSVMWRQCGESWAEPGERGEMVAYFKSSGPK